MSATARGHGQRRPQDHYVTPAWAVEVLEPHLPVARQVVDPCAGDGSLLVALRAAWHARRPRVEQWCGVELEPVRAQIAARQGLDVVQGDGLQESWGLADLVVANPPFAQAMAFLLRAQQQVVAPGGTAAFLLRLAMLAGQRRRDFWKMHPADVYVLSRRPSFTEDGATDATDYAWFVWGPGRGGRWGVL